MTDSIAYDPKRMTNITATDMATLFSLNPYESPASIVHKKTDPKPIYAPAMRRGHLFEPAVLEAFRIDMGVKSIRNAFGTYVMDNHRIAATPDAFVDNHLQNVTIEAKSIGSQRFAKWYVEAPLYYQMQVHTQMMVIDAAFGYIGALEAGDPSDCQYRFIAWKINRCPELEAMMKKEVIRFWQCFDKKEPFRANSDMKKKAIELLAESATLVYPEDPMSYLEEDAGKEYEEKIRAIFEEREPK